MVLSQYEKEENSKWWKRQMNWTNEGGFLIWKDKGHFYEKKGNKLIAPNKRAYKDIMANTTREFFEAHILKN